MSKPVGRIIAARLERHTNRLSVLPAEQFGFRHRHSTEQQVIRLVEYATMREKSDGLPLLRRCQSIQSRLDDGLILQRRQLGYPANIIQIVASFLTNWQLEWVWETTFPTTGEWRQEFRKGQHYHQYCSPSSPQRFRIMTAQYWRRMLTIRQ